MAEKGKNSQKNVPDGKDEHKGEQLDLIDVAPENAKPIIKAARIYKSLQLKRISALNEEVKQKHRVLELVKAAKLQPLENGRIQFECDGVVVTVTPRDELIKIKDKTDEAV